MQERSETGQETGPGTGPATGGPQDYTVWNALVDIVAAPGQALDAAKHHTRWFWVPLLLTLGVTAGVIAYYSFWVDFDWLIAETIRNLPAEQAASGDQIREFMSPGRNAGFGVVGVVVVTFVIYALQAAYLHMVNKLGGDPELGYGHWFGFSAWTAFVGIFQSLLMLAVILMADSNQLPQQDLTPLSMNALFFQASPGDDWFTWGQSLSLFNIWMLVLMTIGWGRWTGASTAKSAMIVTAPWAVLFGGWALIIGL